MDNIIIVAVILIVIVPAAWYVIKSKKSGRTCIGCPDNGKCPSQSNGKCSGNCTSCNCDK